MKASFIYLLRVIFGLLDLIFFLNKKDIIFHGYRGVPSGNNLALYSFIKSNKLLKCDLYWTGNTTNFANIDPVYTRETPSRNSPLIVHLSYLFFLMRFKVIIVESAGDLSFYLRFLSGRLRIKVLLLHGFCLKGCGILAPNLNKEQKEIWSQVGRSFNLISVSSQLERYLISSTFNAPLNNCIVMGPQRSRLAKPCKDGLRREARSLIQDTYCVNLDNNQQIIFYTPTHRDHTPEFKRPILFGFDSTSQLNEELIKSNTLLFIREHGISADQNHEIASNIINTSDAPSIDFHLLSAGVDGLITDYSGIFLEYLNSNIKFGFWQYDLEEYRQKRGFSINENVFKTGSVIDNTYNFIDFCNKKSISIETKLFRDAWHDLLYEKTTSEALELTLDEIKKRAKSLV